jgi:hypothetical protein
MNIEEIISIVSAVIALTSAIFAWKAIKTSERTYKAGIIVQIYETYHSPSIRKIYEQFGESIGRHGEILVKMTLKLLCTPTRVSQ